MTFLRGLLAARSHLAFLLGVVLAVAVVRFTARLTRAAVAPLPERATALVSLVRALPLREPGPLTPRERALARAAFRYLERNTDPRTGFTASVEGYPSTTLWDLGSQLMALVAAEDLGLASPQDARRRIARALETLASVPLCRGLPNKVYDTRTAQMVDYHDGPAPTGIGWSALDIGRVLVPLSLVVRRAPELTPLVERVLARWDLAALSDGVSLRGASRRPDGGLESYQEGRLGYEQYAARALLPWGVPAGIAMDYVPHAAFVRVGGQAVPQDDRDPAQNGGAHNAVLSEPWVLEGIEHGFDAVALSYARAVLGAQERRFEATGKLTAVSEDALDRPPGFSYSAVLNGGDAWTAFSPDGTPAPAHLTFSTKAAVGWGALFAGSYPERLLAAAAELVAAGGLYAGRYDATGEVNRVLSLNTNAVVLEALAYRLHGPFFRPASAAARSEPLR